MEFFELPERNFFRIDNNHLCYLGNYVAFHSRIFYLEDGFCDVFSMLFSI